MAEPEMPIEIVPYDPAWPSMFEVEATVLSRALDREAYTQAKGPFIDRITRIGLEAGYGAEFSR